LLRLFARVSKSETQPGFESGIVAKNFRFLVFLIAPIFLANSGCAGFSHQVRPTTFSACQQPSRGVIFLADGAGDFQVTSSVLERVLVEDHVPLEVRSVRWSHGYWRVAADQFDEMHARAEGWKLAEQIKAERRAHPEEEIYLLGYSAGSSVILSAAEELPPQIVDRIILLAASAPTNYDLRPALRSSRDGIDSFYSRRDRWCLGLFLRMEVMLGIKYTPAGGRIGFRPVIESPEDAVCYSRLRQHPWEPEWEWAGNGGGHYGAHQPEFLRLFILPLLNHKAQP
jgi:pimeloyl-ACP methyl ester carboxylesterase